MTDYAIRTADLYRDALIAGRATEGLMIRARRLARWTGRSVSSVITDLIARAEAL